MRGRGSAAGRTPRRRLSLAAAVCAGCFVLLTCTPPDFTPVDTGDPLTLSPLQPELTAGMSFTFTAAGGTPPYAYSVTGVNPGTIDSTGKYTAPTTPTTATVKVTDYKGAAASTSVVVRPSQLWVVPTDVTIPSNSTITFNGHGGTPPYTYSIFSGIGGINPSTGVYSSTGSGDAIIMVTDSASKTVTTGVTVTAAPEPLTITPTSATVVRNGNQDFTAAGGTPPYSFTLVGNGSIAESGNPREYTAGSSAGSATLTLTDSVGRIVSAPITVTDALGITPSSTTVPINGSVSLAAGGGSTSGYTWAVTSGGGSVDPSVDSPVIYTAPGTPGPVTVTVTDSTSATANCSITVTPGPLTISPAEIAIPAGSSVTFTASGGLSYTYSKPSGVGTINAATGDYTSAVQGAAVVRVTDNYGRTQDASVTVTAPPAPPLNLSPVLVYVQTGSDQTFTASGGTTPYAWSVLEGAAGGSINSSGVYTAPATVPASPTDYTVRVTDSADPAQHLDATVRVYTPLAISPTPASIDAGTPVDFSAAGGVPPFTFTLPTNHGSLAVVDADTVRYTAPGTMVSETIRVTDDIGKFVEWSFTVVDPAKWTPKTTIDPTKAGLYASMALDGSGAPQVVYYESVGKDLKIARWVGSWSISTVDATANVVKYPSLAIDGSGNAHVAWSESGSIYYKAWDGSAWTLRETAVATGAGQFVSLALDGTGKPGIAYYDSAAGDLKFTAWNGSEWTWPIPIVDETGNVGQYASLAFDGANRPRVAYHDVTSGSLKYAEWDGSAWDISTVDSSGSVGQFASLELSSTGAPCIAYYAFGSKDLKYAWRPLSTWVDAAGDVGAETVAGTGDVGQFASLALDPGDAHPVIAFYDLTNGNLRYAEWNPTAALWVVGTVDGSANNVGQYLTLGVDPIGKMKIAYHDATGVDLLFIQEQ